jgi:DNA polymerase alpha-associated DNA helicase A
MYLQERNGINTHLKSLKISHGVPEAEIAIITPYQAQVAHLSALLRDEFPGLVCGSVDGMQGQEREVGSPFTVYGATV